MCEYLIFTGGTTLSGLKNERTEMRELITVGEVKREGEERAEMRSSKFCV